MGIHEGVSGHVPTYVGAHDESVWWAERVSLGSSAAGRLALSSGQSLVEEGGLGRMYLSCSGKPWSGLAQELAQYL